MITVYPVLRQHMKERKVTYKELAAVINNNVFSVHLKMLGIKRWKLAEAVSICCFFHTQDIELVFEKR